MTNQPPYGGSGERPDDDDQTNRYGDPGHGQQGQGEGQYGQGQYGQGQYGPGAYGAGQAGYPGGPPGSYPPGPPPGGYPGYPGYPGGANRPPAPPSNPLAALFDFGFNQFVTPYVVKFLYILLTVVLGLGYLFVVVAGFSQSLLFGLVALVGGAVGFLIYLTLARVTLEFYYAVVRMSEDIHHRR
ncbi:DUF4282 domain-containing protein [Pseudonocardia nantongensis]|uniref:DUF4282 domain-containing protein n=1 Tax=Pseudonocardia nantongensis TaxID=1181885 RepID=UPI00397A4AE7